MFFKYQISFASIILPCAMVIHAADNVTDDVSQTTAKLDKMLEYVPRILNSFVVVGSGLLEDQVKVKVEGVNFCDIDPLDTHKSPFVLPYTALSEEISLDGGSCSTYKLTYKYSVLTHSSEKEFLLIYPRLCITSKDKKSYIKLMDVGRAGKSTLDLFFDKKKQIIQADVYWDNLNPEHVIPGEERAVQRLHFARFIADKKDKYNLNFLIKCEKHVNEDEWIDEWIKTVETGQMTF